MSGSFGKKLLGPAVAALIVVVLIGVKSHSSLDRARIWAQAPAAVRAAAADQDGPIEMPPLPDVGPGREIEPGVLFHEVGLPGGDKPGFAGKLWLYLPAGDHAEHSLPCVLITAGGSSLLKGIELGEGARPEHLPYVRAGFAVLAYELDGAFARGRTLTEAEMSQAMLRFLAARAGLVNAHVALGFVFAKVPQVDPRRIYTAGHSSAATTAMLFAEHEPAVRGCVAYAPAINLEKQFGADAVPMLRGAGFADLVDRYAPIDHESKLGCPIMLFHARDDGTILAAETEACAARLKVLGKAVTLVIVPSGGHYDSMIRQGIPRGIAWLQELDGTGGTEIKQDSLEIRPLIPQAAPSLAPATSPEELGEKQPHGLYYHGQEHSWWRRVARSLTDTYSVESLRLRSNDEFERLFGRSNRAAKVLRLIETVLPRLTSNMSIYCLIDIGKPVGEQQERPPRLEEPA
jgi:dienelactone hydrolase